MQGQKNACMNVSIHAGYAEETGTRYDLTRSYLHRQKQPQLPALPTSIQVDY